MTPPLDPRDPRELLALVAARLGDAKDQFVFLGGAACALYVTDVATLAPRATKDVDALYPCDTYSQYHWLGESVLKPRGFVPDAESGLTCRWRIRPEEIRVDVLPTNPKAPGATARMRLVRLADPIRRASLIRSAAWRTERRTPRTPFSAATTFSQPINITDRWETIAEALLPYDRQRFDTIVEEARVAAQKRGDPDRSWPRSMPA